MPNIDLDVTPGHVRTSSPSIAHKYFISSLIRAIFGLGPDFAPDAPRAFVFCFPRVRLFLLVAPKTQCPRYCAATGIFAGPPCGMISFGSVTACTCSIVASGAISFSTNPSAVTSIHANSVMM